MHEPIEHGDFSRGQREVRRCLWGRPIEHRHPEDPPAQDAEDRKLVRRWAVLSFDSSTLQPDLRILWNTSIFHLKAYHSSFSIASAREPTGRSVISFQAIFFLFFGVPRSSAWITVKVSGG